MFVVLYYITLLLYIVYILSLYFTTQGACKFLNMYFHEIHVILVSEMTYYVSIGT